MAYPTLEQTGIILNMFAVVLMGIDLFLKKDQIDRLEKRLNRVIDTFSIWVKNFIFSNRSKELLLILVLIYFTWSTPYSEKNEITFPDTDMIINYKAYHIPESIIIYLVWNVGMSVIISLLIGFVMTRAYDKLDPYIGRILLNIVEKAFHLIRGSPKGVIGSIGIMFFLIGSALQLWATTLRL